MTSNFSQEKEKTIEYTVTKQEEGKRIDRFLSEQAEDMSRSYLQKLLKDGRVTIQGKACKSSYKVEEGDHILLTLPPDQILELTAENIPMDILYEDEDLLVVNKPKDMVVHPAAGHYSGTLVNALMYHCGDQLSGINGVMRPGIVHRIDKDTTGALVICKTDRAHHSLAEQLSVHSITRRYRALVWNNIKEEEGTVNAPIGRDPKNRKKMAINYSNGKEAITHYRVLERFGKFTYIECELETGRTHQIRVHMTSIGHPLLGDEVYGPSRSSFKLQGQCLHAMVLGFIHPVRKEYMEFTAPLPDYFEKLLLQLK